MVTDKMDNLELDNFELKKVANLILFGCETGA